MTEKQQLIEAFKMLDFKMLNTLLDDNLSYMDVPKKLFLERLSQQITKYENLNAYENVTVGICGTCNKGWKAYKFSSNECPSLNLFFEEKDNKVSDIYICNDLNIVVPNDNDWNIYFKFYEEEKVDFKPSLDYNINLQKVEEAMEEFNAFVKSGFVTSQDVVYWYNKHNALTKKLNLNDPFVSQPYKAFEKLDSIYSEVSNLVHNHNKNGFAKEALKEYQNINRNSEKSLVNWVLSHKNEYFFSLKKTDNWKNTSFIILETEPSLVIDCNECLDSFLFEDLYSNLERNLLEKYEPTKEHYEQNGGSINYSLETFLRLHKKYLDLL